MECHVRTLAGYSGYYLGEESKWAREMEAYEKPM